MSPLLLILSIAFAGTPPADVPEENEEVLEEEETEVGPDRSAPPAVIPAIPLELGDAEVHQISDAVTVRLVTLPGVRKVEVSITARRGTIDVDGTPSIPGSATGELMDIATGERDAEDIEVLSAVHDLSVWSSSTSTHTQSVHMDVPRMHLDVGFGLLSDTIREPAFPGKDTKRYQREDAFYYTAIAPADLGSVASSARRFSWYEAEHPFGTRLDLQQLKDVKPKNLQARHAEIWATAPIEVLVVGDVGWADVEAPLTAMLGDLGTAGERLYSPVHEPKIETRVLAVNMPGSEQAAIRARLAGPRFDHADRDIAAMVDFALGGHFLSRLNRNLREEKGFTYGSGSNLSSGRASGTWDIGLDVEAANVVEAIKEIEIELIRLAEGGVEQAEIESAVGERIQSWNRTRLTASTGLRSYDGLWNREESAADSRARLLGLREISLEDTQRVASEWLGSDAPRLWVIVGDQATLEGPLKELGLPVEWIEPQDAILGSF